MDMKYHVEDRLQRWAHWYCYLCDHGLGYRKKTVEARLMEEGNVLIASTAPSYVPEYAREEKTHLLINKMADQNFKVADVLRQYYCEPGKLSEKAERLNISLSQFKINLAMGKQWLAGRLSGELDEQEIKVANSRNRLT